MWCEEHGSPEYGNIPVVLQEASRDARENLEAALESKEEAVHQLEEALTAREASLEEALEQHHELTDLSNQTAKELQKRHQKA